MSEEDLLLDAHENHVDFLPLFQDLTPGFESLYSPTQSLSTSEEFEDHLSTLKMDDFLLTSLESEPIMDNYTHYSPTTSYHDEMTVSNNTTPWNEVGQIRILGVQNTGAKSRVETQIKLCIQLMSNNKKNQDWSYIKLHDNMLARSRLRKQQQQKLNSIETTTIISSADESKVLQLDAKVVCASNTDQPIRMCVGCVRRERKRAERTKDGKQNHEMVLSHQEIEAERDRILLFNCSPMINFSSGDAILPTRITCYCRHHSEKNGFRICFEMKNHLGQMIGKGISPAIMITDDHKSSKQKMNRKRSREEDPAEAISRPDTPADSRRNSMSTIEDADFTMTATKQLTPLQTPPAMEMEEEVVISPLDQLNILPPENEAWPFNRRRRITIGGYATLDNISDLLQVEDLPQLGRLVPSQGPTYGGVEVTLLGSGFYRGLTCLFGEHAATTTFWNSSTMVCILPPAAHTGPVVVSFKEHPLVLEGQDVAIFTYYDASDQALLELALQVVGLKMTGKLQDAKSVAMRIVQGGQQDQQQTQQQQDLIDRLQYAMLHQTSLDLTIVNASGQTLLHLAVMVDNQLLAKTLIQACSFEDKLKLINMQDKNDMTALGLAVHTKSLEMIKLLVSLGANTALVAPFDDKEITLLLKPRKPSLSRRSSGVKSHLMHRFHSLSSTETVTAGDKPSMESDGLGLVRQKIDRRLYLFWLPVLILAVGLLGVHFIPSFQLLEKLPTRIII